MMEGTMDILTLCRLYIRAIQSQINLQKLIITVDIVEDILCGIHHNLSNGLLLYFNKLRALTVSRADRVLLGAINLVFIRSGLKREDHTMLTGNDETTTVWFNAIDANAIVHTKAWRVRNLNNELTIHVADEDVTLSGSHDQLDCVFSPAVTCIRCRDGRVTSCEL